MLRVISALVSHLFVLGVGTILIGISPLTKVHNPSIAKYIQIVGIIISIVAIFSLLINISG